MSNDGKLYISDVAFESLSRGDVQEVSEKLHTLDQSNPDCEEIVASLFCDLVVVYEDGGVTLDTIIAILSETITSDLYSRAFCMVLGSFPNTNRLNDLLVNIVKKGNIIDFKFIAAHVGSEFIRDLGVLPRDTVSKALNIGVRDHFYTQSKFNLIHEELEGYAKLHNDLFHVLKADPPTYTPQYALEIIQTLIGHYNLDPNRCLGVFLNVSSTLLHCRSQLILQILKASQWWPSVESDNSSFDSLSVGGNNSAAKTIALEALRVSPEFLEYAAMSCFLIKEGFVSFGRLWSLLQPLEQEMDDLEGEYRLQLDEKVSRAGANALAMAAPLMDEEDAATSHKDTVAGDAKSDQEPTATKLSFHQRISTNAKFIFLKQCLAVGLYWPSLFILKSYPFLAHVDEETATLINRLSEACISPLYAKIESVPLEMIQDVSRRKKNGRIINSFERVWSTDACNPDPHYVYFDASWDAAIPKVTTIDELFEFSDEFLKFSGPSQSRNPVLFQKLCRIGRHALDNEPSPAEKEKWFHYIRNYIFPSLVLAGESSVVVDEAFQLLAHYPVGDRYCLYGELYQVLAKNNPYIKMAYAKAEKETKDMLKRLSKENVPQMTRRFAKLTVANPLPCFLVIIQQIESYDNLISLVVESARYFNRYGWDVLTAAILMRLTANGRSTTQEDGMNDRRWLQSLASFVGKLCEKYPAQIDLKMLMSYILKSFHAVDNSPLVVLREILSSMGGMQATTNLTARQVNIMGCGASLERIVFGNIGDNRYDSLVSGDVLINCLAETDCVTEVLVLLCGMFHTHKDETVPLHLKVAAAKLDDVYMVARLFVLMVTFFGNEKPLNLVPVFDLVSEYNVEVPWAFELWRPVFLRQIVQHKSKPVEAWGETLQTLISHTGSMGEVTGGMNPKLFVSFWILSLHDINYDEAVYHQERKKLETVTKSLRDFIHISAQDKEVSASRIEEARRMVKQNEKILQDLPADMQSHKNHNEFIANILESESQEWFNSSKAVSFEEDSRVFLQHCILPRSVHSAFDAVFCARMLIRMHSLNLASFSLVSLLDQLIKGQTVFTSMFTMTPIEAENFGLFFAELFKTLSDWSVLETFDGISLHFKGNELENMSYDEYRLRLYDYHCVLLDQLESALQSTEYMCRRNAITFLKNLLGIYPVVEDHCERVLQLIQDILNTDEREDLKLSSSALCGHLMSKQKEWIHMWDFTPMSAESKELHVAKRKELSAERAKLQEEAKRKADIEREEAARIVKQQEEEKKRQNQLDYDAKGTGSSSARELRTSAPSSRGRYDNYTDYTAKPANTDVASANSNKSSTAAKESATSTRTEGSEGVKKDEIATDPNTTGSDSVTGPGTTSPLVVDAAAAKMSTDEKASNAGLSPASLSKLNAEKGDVPTERLNGESEAKNRPSIKEKLLEAKRELQAKNEERVSSPAPKRAPLLPQWKIARESDSKHRGLTATGPSSAAQGDRKASGAAAPLPPPPTPPPMNNAATSNNHGPRFPRGDGSGSHNGGRKFDGPRYKGRPHDDSRRDDTRKRNLQGPHEGRDKRARY